MTTLALLIGLFIHWFADFVLQTHKQAMNKSSSWAALLAHTWGYTVIWWIVLLYVRIYDSVTHDISPLFSWSLHQGGGILLFCLITFVAHTVTDYITSREAKKFFDVKNYHNGFVVVGFDQILHYIQLYFTAQLCHFI